MQNKGPYTDSAMKWIHGSKWANNVPVYSQHWLAKA